VSNKLDSLSDDEVRQIAQLVETLDRSTFEYLQVEVGNLKVTIGKGSLSQSAETRASSRDDPSGVSASAEQPPLAAPSPGIEAAPAISAPPPSAQAVTDETRSRDGTVTIVAPLLGRFYAQPEPGAAPFVSVGEELTPDTTVGLIEVMKVFTAVRAGVNGVVTEICVQDAEFVEHGRILFRVRPVEAVQGRGGVSRKGVRS